MFALGGTIASASVAGRAGADVSLSGEELLRVLPSLDSIASVTVRSFRKVPSGDLTMHDVLELAAAIRSEVDGGTRGVVVTQGTDTLEEVAYALDLLLHVEAPVVVTGAMRNSSLPGSDGPANMLAAIKVASSEAARGMGALVVFNDEIHAARFVRKRHTTSPATFGSPLAGPLGLVTEDRVSVFVRARGRLHVQVGAEAPDVKVALISVAFDDDGGLLQPPALVGYQGAVVAAFGAGHVPRKIVPRLRELNERMPVVVASRTFAGDMLRATYSYPGGEMDLLSNGLIFAGALDAPHARILLRLLLMARASREVIVRAFESAMAARDDMTVAGRK